MSQYEMLYLVCDWHANTLQVLKAMQNAEFEIKAHGQNGESVDIELTDEKKKGFEMALMLIEHHIRSFPVKYELDESETQP